MDFFRPFLETARLFYRENIAKYQIALLMEGMELLFGQHPACVELYVAVDRGRSAMHGGVSQVNFPGSTTLFSRGPSQTRAQTRSVLFFGP